MAFDAKKKSEKRKTPAQVTMRLTEEENDILIEEGNKLGMNKANFVKYCIQQYLENKKEFE